MVGAVRDDVAARLRLAALVIANCPNVEAVRDDVAARLRLAALVIATLPAALP